MKIGRNLSNSLLRSEIFNRVNKSFGTPTGAVVGRHFRPLIGFVCSIGVLLALVGLSKSAADPSGNPALKTGMVGHTATAQTPWIKLAPTGGPPGARELHVAVYDPATNRMTIHGGEFAENGFTALNDAWILTNADGTETTSPTWTKLLPANPLRRMRHAAVYDSLSNRMIIFAGTEVDSSSTIFNDVWVLTNANGTGGDPAWLQLTPSGGLPAARENPTAIYDSASNRMTIFGGAGVQGAVLSDVWILTNANGTEPALPSWIQLFPTTQITPRNFDTAVYDAQSNRMIVFGGLAENGSQFLNDVWVLTNANGIGGDPEWVELAPDGAPPAPRYTQAAVFDPTTNRMVVYGGSNQVVAFGDTWVLTNANGAGSDAPTWVSLKPGGTLPPARQQLGATYSVSTNRLSIFGGNNAPICCGSLNDVWVLPDANGLGGTGGTCVPPPPGLVSWWSGDKTADDVQGTNPGEWVGSASYKRGMVGPGFLFDGISNRVTVPNSNSLSPSRLTLDAWVYSTGRAGEGRDIILKDKSPDPREYLLGVASQDTFVGDIWLAPNALHVQVMSTTIVQLNTWYHVAITHDGTKLRLYVNGILETVADAVGTIGPTANPVGIGGKADDPLFFQGIIDEAQIFNRALTDSEILAIYQAGADGQCKPDIFVTSITPSYEVVGRRFLISTSVVIQDENGIGIEGSSVQIKATLPSGSVLAFPVTTDASGQATVSFTSKETGLFKFKVLKVMRAGRDYDASLNIETSDTLLIP